VRERFDYYSFRWYVSQKINGRGLAFAMRNWYLVILSYDDDFQAGEVQEIITESVIECIDAPHGAPDGARQRALLDAPLSAHCEAVENALLIRKDYLKKRGVKSADGIDGEEWIVDLRKVQDIIIETRARKDVELACQLLEGDSTVSYRGFNDKLKCRLGGYFSQSRIKTLMKGLDKAKKTEVNGHLRSMGRDVL
jgi:hypothetical protein